VRQAVVQREPGSLVEQDQSRARVPVSESRIWAWALERRTFCIGVPVVPLPPARVINPAFAVAEAMWILSGSDDQWIYLLKDARPADLADAIRAVAGGDAVIAPGVTRRLLDNFASLLPDLRSSEPQGSPALDQLTSRERQVLVHVAEGMSNSEIAAALHVSEATVKSHLGRVLAKLSLRDRVQTVIFAYQAGLVHPQRPGSP